jgi:acetolactate synthase-1/2/3 large subunit
MDSLHKDPEIALISARHESGAAFMACGYARATGRPGVCLGTRGVGAANMTIAIHTAQQDSVPMVAIIGQVSTTNRHREAIQEIDLPRAFGPITKWAVEVPRADRIPEIVTRALVTARTGRPGPVLVAIPADLMDREIPAITPIDYPIPPRPRASPAELRRCLDLLAESERPLLIVGGGAIWAKAESILSEMAEWFAMPTIAGFQRCDAFPNDHPLYLGSVGPGAAPALQTGLPQVDLVLAVGTRLGESTSASYTLIRDRPVIHVDIDPAVLASATAMLPICADAESFASDLLALAKASYQIPDALRAKRLAWAKSWRAAVQQESRLPTAGPGEPVHPAAVLDGLQRLLPEKAAVTVDVGNFVAWFVRYFRWRQQGTFFGPTSSAMGYGLPAALGVKLGQPHRPVITVCGDGGFMMSLGELETAVRHAIPVLAVVWNNFQYGTVRGYQARRFPGRYEGTLLTNPDFARVADLFGAYGETVHRNEEVFPALTRALRVTQAGRPAVLDVRIDPNWIDPDHYLH